MPKENDKCLGYRDIPQTEYRNKNGIITRGPCILYDIMGCDDSDNIDMVIYDGLDTNGKLMFEVHSLMFFPFVWNSQRGQFFRQGIYITMDAATSSVTLSFLPWEYEGKQG